MHSVVQVTREFLPSFIDQLCAGMIRVLQVEVSVSAASVFKIEKVSVYPLIGC